MDRKRWPSSIQTGKLDLPFDLDIILSDRRLSATGFHAHVLLRSSLGLGQGEFNGDIGISSIASRDGLGLGDSVGNGIQKDEENTHGIMAGENIESVESVELIERVRLFDTEIGDPIPTYNQEDQTFVLFPSENSIPLSTVANSIQRLVVLDCKWTKTGTQENISEIAHLPKVHLDNPPSESFFWRWHNAGSGMCSTLEAIYYAALEVSRGKSLKEFDEDNRNAMIDLMWLFGIQRAATALGARREGKPLPFSTDGKNMQRGLRRTEKGSEKHLRDLENGRKLKLKEEVS